MLEVNSTEQKVTQKLAFQTEKQKVIYCISVKVYIIQTIWHATAFRFFCFVFWFFVFFFLNFWPTIVNWWFLSNAASTYVKECKFSAYKMHVDNDKSQNALASFLNVKLKQGNQNKAINFSHGDVFKHKKCLRALRIIVALRETPSFKGDLFRRTL